MAKVDPIVIPGRSHRAPAILWIGSRQRPGVVAKELSEMLGLSAHQIVAVHISDLNKPLIERINPTIALSMLTWMGGDALETSRALRDAQFTKRYRVFSPALPKPNLVEREIRNSVPEIDFGIISDLDTLDLG